MNEALMKQLNDIFKSFPEIKLVYFFGSKSAGDEGLLSDYDFAFYLDIDKKDRKKIYEIKIGLLDKVSLALKSDKIDIVILNSTQSPELKYNIIKNGKLIYKEEPFKVLIEPKILTEYFDFHESLVRHHLTRA
tara:strand:+ start:322 stop:720 length:399 start_codon:yes stop_codon:yes gene_type:complete